MDIGIIGVGMVGGTIKYGFERLGHTVIPHDIKLTTSLRDTLRAEVIFICVPTPSKDDGSCDTILVEEVVEDLAAYRYEGLVVIKSTVTPGTTDKLIDKHTKLRIAFCPEFLREKTAYTDFIDHHDVCIIGATSDDDYKTIKEAHGNLPNEFVKLEPLEAEFCKYFSNVFNALRIVFANEFYDVCDAAGADYRLIKNAIVKRHNIGDYYLECNDAFRAFGGHCLPKDTAAFANYSWHKTRKMGLFDYIVGSNNRTIDETRPEED